MPEAAEFPGGVPRGDIEGAVARAAAAAPAWAALDPGQRVGLLRACLRSVASAADAWVGAACAMKGAEPGGVVEAEERLAGPVTVLRHLRLYADALAGGAPALQRLRCEDRAGGTAVRVFPRARYDGLLYTGLRADVMLGAGERPRPWHPGEGGAAAVLGAGNVTAIPVLDALWQLVAERRTVVVKLHPVMAGLQDALERAFAPLLAGGFLVFVSGGAEDGAALVTHPRIAAVHLTGSLASARAVVEHALPAGRPFTAELGAVTPVLVVPGPWSRGDLRQQARSVAGMMQVNGGLNCLTPKLLLTAAGWPQRARFLDELRKALAEQPARADWYPGAARTRARFAAAAGLAAETPGVLLATGVPPDPGAPLLTEEFFGAQLAECALPAETPEEFLALAVRCANDRLYGDLSCVVLAPPHTSRAALEAAVDGLRYGTVAVNTWSALGFILGDTPWQAFPGARLDDLRSGIGTVHHAALFADPVKAVLRAPFRPGVPPLWMRRPRGLPRLARALQAYEGAPGFAAFLRVAGAALAG